MAPPPKPNESQIGSIDIALLNEVFPLEIDLQDYLERSPAAISSILPSPVSELEPQPSIGNLRADLGGELDDGRAILMELQIYRSDATHLGQVVADASVAQPDLMVWIAESWRPEGRESVRYLNDHPDTHLLTVQLTMVRIGSSPPAPMFQVVAGATEPLQQESRDCQLHQRKSHAGTVMPDPIPFNASLV